MLECCHGSRAEQKGSLSNEQAAANLRGGSWSATAPNALPEVRRYVSWLSLRPGPLLGGGEERKSSMTANEQRLYAALDSLLTAWWDEFDQFFGGDPIADAQNKEDFEAVPAVIEARAVLAALKE